MTEFLKSIDPELFKNVRVIERGDELFFVGKDICDALGYKRASDLLKSIPDEFKHKEKIDDYFRTVITEKAMFFLLQQTRKKSAEKFQWWLADIASTRVGNDKQ